MKNLFALLTICLLFACSGGADKSSKKDQKSNEESALLRMDVNQGDQYSFNINLEGNVFFAMDISMDMMYTISSVTENNLTMDMSFNSIKMDMSIGDESLSYDSDNPDLLNEEVSSMHSSFLPLLNQNITSFTMNNRGEVLSFDYNEEFENNPVMQDMVGSMSESAQNQFVTFPEEPIEIGQSFFHTSSSDGIEIELTYTLREITNSQYLFDVSSNTIETEFGFGMKMSGTSGFYKSGMPSNGKINLEYTGEEFDGFSMNISFNSNIL